jgi:hypothetical protein
MDQVASKVTPTKHLKGYKSNGVESELSSDKDPSTAAHHIQTDASYYERKPAFKYSSCDFNTNQEEFDDDRDYNNKEVEEGVENTQADNGKQLFDSSLNKNQQNTLINPRLHRPSMKYETILIYNFSPTQATRQREYLLFERLFPNSSLGRSDTMGPLNVPSSEFVDGFLHKDFGSLYINGLKKRSYNDIPASDFEGYQSEASCLSIKLRTHQGLPSPTIISNDSYQFFLHDGIEHEDMINALDIEI